MKSLSRRSVGIILFIAVVLFSAGYQWLGPGLVIIDHPPTPPEQAAQGITIVQTSSYHAALVPLTILALVSFIMAVLPAPKGRAPEKP